MSVRSIAIRCAVASLAFVGTFVSTANAAPAESEAPPPTLTLLIDGEVIRDDSVISTGTTITAVAGGLLNPGVGDRELRIDLDDATIYESDGVTAPEGWLVEWSTDDGDTWVDVEPGTPADVTSVRATASVSAGEITSSTQRYSKELNATVPASTFSGSTGGDGWDVFFYDDYVLNIFHHNSSAISLDCHLRSTGERCDGFLPTDNTKSKFDGYQTANRSGGWVDGNTGYAYAFTIESATSRPGALCIDLNVAPPESCGFVALNAATNVTSFGSLSNAEGVGGRLFGMETVNQQLLCLDPETGAACAGSPVALSGGTSSNYYHVYGLGTKVFASTDTTLYCFNSGDLSACGDGWPVTYADLGWTVANMSPVAHMDASGIIDGVCMWNGCLDLAGVDQTSGEDANWVNPHSITSWSANAGSNGGSGQYGKFEAASGRAFLHEVLQGSPVDVFCFDYATEAACDGFDTTPTTDYSLYALRADPNNPTCIWYNSDPGKIGLFDAITGAAECTANPVVTLQPSAFAPRFVCATSGGIDRWVSVELDALNGTAPVATQTLTIRTGNGDAVEGWTNVPIALGETLDLSDLSVEDTGARPTFNVGFSLTAGSLDDVDFEIIYEGRGPELCVDLTVDNTAADGAPNCPAIISLTASIAEDVDGEIVSDAPERGVVASGDAIECPEDVILATVPDPVRNLASSSTEPGEGAFTFRGPVDDGGAPIRWFEYSIDGGTWKVVTSEPNGNGYYTVPLTGLDDGESYDIEVRSRNLLGASNAKSTELTVADSAPAGTPDVDVDVDPGTKASKAPVVVSATGLTPGAPYRVELDTGEVLATGVVDENGSISITVKLPADVKLGERVIKTIVEPLEGDSITVDQPVFIDWSGSIASTESAGGFTAIVPKRVLDSRETTKLAARSTKVLTVATNWSVPADAHAVVVNVTSTQSEGEGWVTAYPCDSGQPGSSTLNMRGDGQDVANLSLVSVGRGEDICLYSTVATHLVVDLSGYYTPLSDARMSSHGPTRVVDTRESSPLAGLNVLEVKVTGAGLAPSSSTAVMLNVTSTEAVADGYLTVYPCGGTLPVVSNVNYQPGSDAANSVAVKVGDGGKVCVYSSATTHVVVDLNGSFGATGTGNLMSLVPGRLVDSRLPASTTSPMSTGTKLRAGKTMVVDLDDADAPSNATSVVFNVTVTGAEGNGFLTVYGCGQDVPLASNVNYQVGRNVANMVTVDLGADDSVCFYTLETIDLVIDVSGFYLAAIG